MSEIFTSIKDGYFDDPEIWNLKKVPSNKCEVNIFHKIIAPRQELSFDNFKLSLINGGKLQFSGFSFGG